jgi:hypothetical protein
MQESTGAAAPIWLVYLPPAGLPASSGGEENIHVCACKGQQAETVWSGI